MFCFDDYRVDSESLSIFRGEARLDAPPQTVEVLAYLIANSGRTVSREELIERFWARAGTGAEASLNTCIRRIRAVLGDDADEPKYVQTRPRSGYRFVGVLLDEAPAPQRRLFPRAALACAVLAVVTGGVVWAHGVLAPPQPQRLAVRPIEGLCEYTLFAHFNEGLKESFLAEMARKLPAGYEIVVERDANADFDLRATVRQTPEETVVTLTIVRTRDSVAAWSGEFIEPTNRDNYVPLQRTLAERMAASAVQALGASRTGSPPTQG